MSIESYGGSPDIVAAREEIHRVAFQIKLAAEELTVYGSLESLLSDPFHQLQFRIASIGIHSKLERLYSSCMIAAEGYFSVEAQIHRRFEIAFVPELALLVQNFSQSLGWKIDNKVSASKVAERPTRTPGSITSMLDRLNSLSSKANPTIGIDIFESEGTRTALVYIPGTQSFSFGSKTNPLDMQSNIVLMAEPSAAASERAVLLAMTQAGIKASDEVIFIGHSQGGMVAGNLAEHPGKYIAAGLITFGAPIAQLKLARLPVMAIEHKNDPVPNISGRANPLSKNWVTIQRESLPSESKAVLHSHSLKSYRNTTEQVDSSTSNGVRSIRARILGKLRGSSIGSSKDFEIAREF